MRRNDVMTDINPDFMAGLGDVQGSIPTEWVANGNPAPFDNDVTWNNLTVYRLREGIERFFITDINNPAASSLAQSEVFIMHDDINSAYASFMNHIPGGCNVLWLDGHASFLKYPSDTPVSRGWATFLGYMT